MKQEVAQLVYSGGIGKDTEDLVYKDKMKTLEMLMSQNERTISNAVHISQKFDILEKYQ